jgi:protein SCO1/2
MFFGYTYCPDVCPTTLSVLNSVAQRLQDLDVDVRFIMVTVDPERDTPERLAEFVTYFNGDFIGVTGTDEGLEQLTRQLGILHVRVQPEPGSEGYLMDHTAAVFLFDPDGRYHAVFSPPLSAEKIAGDFRKMLQAYQ